MHAHGREAAGGLAYTRHRPDEATLYRLVERHYPAFVAHLAEQGKALPAYVEQEFEAYLRCGRLEHGFLRVRCESCHFERLVAFSCKKRGFCPSCGARRMAETAALLVDEVLPGPAVAEKRLSVNAHGKVVYLLKTPYRDGTTHVVFDPLGFIARLAALVPRPRVNLTRYHGVLAPNHRWRAEVTPAGRGRRKGRGTAQPERSAIERHAAMRWAPRLKRVFGIDVETCVRCGKAVRVIASIEEPALIRRILAHVKGKAEMSAASLSPPSTGPPVMA